MSKSPTYEELLNVVSKLLQLEKKFEQLEQKSKLLERKSKLLERNAEQFKKNAELWKRKADLFEEKANLLQRENDILKEKLAKYENPKNSNNSSVPPSKDENRPFKSKSLRKKTGRKPGGQKGHEGTTLEMVSDPNEIIDHAPEYCKCCGKDLTDTPGEFVGRKQVVDLPPIEPIVTEHRVYKKECDCGHVTMSSFPGDLKAPVSYGPMIESLTGYFHSRQYIPFLRMQELFRDIFSVPISEGGIHCLLNRLSRKALPHYHRIRDMIKDSSVVGTDETGGRLNGKKIWVWTWQNERLTWLRGTDNRGYRTIEENFPEGFKKAVFVHDCWKSHFQPDVQTHQLCTSHLLRELNYFKERYNNHRWPVRFSKLILDGIKLKEKLAPGDYYQPIKERTKLENRLEKLLAYEIDEKLKELVSFRKRMLKYKDYILYFLHHPKVPPDNNGSERAIRNVKVKQKISGQFKSWRGVENFMVLRSITDTTLKNDQNVLRALNLIAKLNPTD
ncbi:IS66 family transposase ISPto7 [subsurface metagenome]